MTHNLCDIADTLYSIDSTSWVENATRLLRLLGCPINDFMKVQSWSINDFLYHDPSIVNNLTYSEKLELNQLISISKVYLCEDYKINCFAIETNTTHQSRTELSAEITIILLNVLLRPSILIIKNISSIVFTGSYLNDENSSLEIFISEWFEYDMLPEKYYKLLEIDFTGDYYDYLYSISRSYQKYKESKTHLLYNCGFLRDEYGFFDEQTRYELVRDHYREIYGYDYYEEYIINEYEKQEDDDIEWTILELQLESFDFDTEEDDGESYNFDDEDYEEDEDDDSRDIFNSDVHKSAIDNPEKMLKFIRERKTKATS